MGNAAPEDSFKAFYENFGFETYPFDKFSAEQESGIQDQIFISPSFYGPIVEKFSNGLGMFLVGERGTGKTAATLDLIRASEATNFIVIIDTFSSIAPDFQPYDLCHHITRSICDILFKKIFENAASLRRLDASQRLLLSYLYHEFTMPTTKAELTRRLSQLQLPRYKRVINFFYNPMRLITSLALAMSQSYLSKEFGIINIPISSGEIMKTYPDLPFKSDNTFNSMDANIRLIEKISDLVK